MTERTRYTCECPYAACSFHKYWNDSMCWSVGIIELSNGRESLVFCGPCRDYAMDNGWYATRLSARGERGEK